METVFTFRGKGAPRDGRVVLVTSPGRREAADRKVYDEFIRSLRFASSSGPAPNQVLTVATDGLR